MIVRPVDYEGRYFLLNEAGPAKADVETRVELPNKLLYRKPAEDQDQTVIGKVVGKAEELGLAVAEAEDEKDYFWVIVIFAEEEVEWCIPTPTAECACALAYLIEDGLREYGENDGG